MTTFILKTKNITIEQPLHYNRKDFTIIFFCFHSDQLIYRYKPELPPPSFSNSFIHSFQYICVSGQQIFTKFRGDFLLWELWNPDFLNTSSENYKSLEGDLLQEVCIQLLRGLSWCTKQDHSVTSQITLPLCFRSATFFPMFQILRRKDL